MKMKNTLVMISALAGAVGAFAQGTINWNDGQSSGTISIMSPNPGTPAVEEVGQTSYDSPVGNANYSGGWIGGTATSPGGGVGATPGTVNGVNYQAGGSFSVGLYLDTSLSALTADILTGTPVATSAIQTGGAAGLWSTSGSLQATDNSVAPGTHVFVGIAAWYAGSGAGSYAAGIGVDPEGYVESTSEVSLGGGGPPALPTPGLSNLGLTSFSLATTTPEPSTIALGVMGASAFLMRLRRKQ
jgi:hypothetical protein